MTSYLTPSPTSPFHTLTPQHPSETSLDLAEVLESHRYPSILTRLGSGSSTLSQESATGLSEDQHKRESNNTFGVGVASEERRTPFTANHQVAMASRHQSARRSQSPPTRSESEEDDIHDVGRGDQSDTEEDSRQTNTQKKQDTRERSKSPAYVAPIPKIGSISPVSPGIQISTADRPELPPFVGSYLVGKLVDEDGDIIDEKAGQLLAHAAGDLPAMVGRRVSNAQGDILGDNGELLGYVADIEWPKTRSPPAGQPRSLFDLMGRATSSLMVDHTGNILDSTGNVVGKFHDNNNPLHRKEKEEKEARERLEAQQKGSENDRQPRSPPPTPSPPRQQQQQQEQSQEQEQSAAGEGQSRPRRTEDERRQNAHAWRKENPNESPSDIFLDVKSTREGIQLTIRIPTVFNGQQTTPHISFS